jgi:hypothetical protein
MHSKFVSWAPLPFQWLFSQRYIFIASDDEDECERELIVSMVPLQERILLQRMKPVLFKMLLRMSPYLKCNK